MDKTQKLGLLFFIIVLLMLLIGCSTGEVSDEPRGYHHTEYNHRYGLAPPVRDIKE